MKEIDFRIDLEKHFVVISEEDGQTDPFSFKIKLSSIQPTESFLIKEEVDQYLVHPETIFTVSPIRLQKESDSRFQYVTITGEAQLFVLHKLGKKEINITTDFNCRTKFVSDLPGDIDVDIEMAIETYEEGIQSFSDYDNRLLSEEEYERILSIRYGGESLTD